MNLSSDIDIELKTIISLVQSDRLPEALKEIDMAIMKNKNELELYKTKTRILDSLGLNNEIIDTWELGIQNNKHEFLFYQEKVQALKSQNKLEEIIQCYDYGIMNNKNDPLFYTYKNSELERQNRKEEVIQGWELGIDNNKTDPYYYKRKVQALIDLFGAENSWEKIVQCWNQAIENGNDAVFYFKSKAFALEQLERWDEAYVNINMFNFCMMIKAFKIQLLLANYLKKLNRLEAILECWNDGIKNNPHNRYFYAKKIKALEEQEKIEQIIIESNIYIKLFNDIVFYEAKTKCLQIQGKIEEVIECWNEGIKQNRYSIQFYLKKIEALKNQQRWINSIQCCDQVLSEKVLVAEILSHKEHSLEQLKQFRKAVQYSRLTYSDQQFKFQF